MQLNAQQKKVVHHQSGPLLVVAGAGTGKTTTIIERIKYLISTKKIDPQQIFAATFTQKSAEEMIERLDTIMPLGYEEPWIGTFHALCDRILKNEGLEIGLDIRYKILTPTDQWILLKENIFNLGLNYYLPLGNPSTFISALATYFSRAQDEFVNPSQLKALAENKEKSAKTESEKEDAEKLLELASAYERYEQIKARESVLDFGDLITKTITLFKDRKSILTKYQNQFTHILIDEFQDTNFAQYQLIKLLAPTKTKPNLLVVGDDDQSIYKFRGAAISNILGFKKDYPNTKEIVLNQNYRSIKSILDSSYALIQHNNPDRLEHKLKIDKKLISNNNKKTINQPTIIQASTGELEVDYVVEKIIELVAKEEYSCKDFAILSRSNSFLDQFVSAFKRAGIPYQRIGNRGLFDQVEIRDLIHFINILSDPNDSVSLFHFLHFEAFSIKPEIILNLIQLSKTQSKSLWEIIKSSKDESISKVVALVQHFQEKYLKESTTNILHQFIIDTNYIKTLTLTDSIENHLKIQNINLFFDRIKKYESSKKDAYLVDFVDALKTWEEAGENPAQAVIEDIDTVNLLTIHASKGLEFPVVFVPSIISGRFPSINRKDKIEFPQELIGEILPQESGHVEEERRLLYVAMTRAKDYLYLSYSPDYGGVRKRKPSGYLKETTLKEEAIDSSDNKQLTNLIKGPTKATYLDKLGEIKIKSLSYTQIDTFKGCPLKYKYRYILKVPTLPYQTLTFGRTIHETLHDFHRFAQQGKNLSQKEFIDLYKSHFDGSGYESQEHKEKRFKKGIDDLKTYFKTHKDLFGKPLHLERSFKLKIDDVTINGKIDRIDETEEGIEIIDYKTGKTKDQKTVDKDEQLSLYALASNEAFGLNPNRVSLYFVETGQKISTIKSPKQLENTKKKLTKDIQKIKSSKFKATPNKIRCKFCEYNRICPFAIK